MRADWTLHQWRHNNVGGVTAGQVRHNSSNVWGVTAGQVRHNSSRYNQQCEKKEMVVGRAYHPPQRRTMDLACHHLETMARKDDMGEQPSDGETTWTNTGETRYGRGKHKTG